VQRAIPALLVLLLGFTLAMALPRFETRSNLVLDESNAIGMALLRASLAPVPHRSIFSQYWLRRFIAYSGALRLMDFQIEPLVAPRLAIKLDSYKP
jgi:hypothetical protein